MAGAVYEARASARDLANTPAPGELVDIGGRRLHIWCAGSGEPVVVLESGLGGTSFDWAGVQPVVSGFTRVCSYDRAGVGYSDAGPGPRTTQHIATDLAQLLDKTDINRPVVLVGASVGAWSVRVLASNTEDRVAGMVLVDPRHELQGPRLAEVGAREVPAWIGWATRLAPVVGHLGIARALGFSPGTSPETVVPAVREYVRATRFRASAIVATAGELGHARESARQVAGSRRVLSVPLVIVSAGQRQNSRVAEVLERLQQEHIQLSAKSCRVIAAASGHGVAFDQPEVVAKAIRAVVVAARVGSTPDCAGVEGASPQ